MLFLNWGYDDAVELPNVPQIRYAPILTEVCEEVRAPLQCPGCSAEAPDGSIFCGKCGIALPRRCPNCGKAVPAENSFCSKCRTRVATGDVASASSTTTRSTAPTTSTASSAE